MARAVDGGSNYTGSYSGDKSVTQCLLPDIQPPKAAIDIEKATNGEDADTPTGPVIPVGGVAIFSYQVRNFGSVPLTNIVVVDDNGTPNETGDDFSPEAIAVEWFGGLQCWGSQQDDVLDLQESWLYSEGH